MPQFKVTLGEGMIYCIMFVMGLMSPPSIEGVLVIEEEVGHLEEDLFITIVCYRVL